MVLKIVLVDIAFIGAHLELVQVLGTIAIAVAVAVAQSVRKLREFTNVKVANKQLESANEEPCKHE